VRRPAGRLEGFEEIRNLLEGVQHLRVLGSAVAVPDGGGASLGDVDKSRRGDDGRGRGGCGVLVPNGGGADVREVDECRRWDYGGGRGGGGGASVGGVDGSRGGDSSGGRGPDLHVNKGVGEVVDAVVRDDGCVRLESVHVASRGREGDVRRVVTLPS
jgi:hypothetical protein